jgi:hypothetical protein
MEGDEPVTRRHAFPRLAKVSAVRLYIILCLLSAGNLQEYILLTWRVTETLRLHTDRRAQPNTR